jgi:glycine hydroxymethyltransferase
MLKDKDNILFQLIEAEANRQETEIELIASENYVSKEVLEAN